MESFLTMQPRFVPNLGTNCHMKDSGHVPVCVVTDINNRILIRNMATTVSDREWRVTKCKVSVNRFWTASNAVIQCTIRLDDLSLKAPAVAEKEDIARFYDQRKGLSTPDSAPAGRTVPKRGGGGTTISEETAPSSSSIKTVDKSEDGQGPLDILDEICIYLGYIDSLRPVTDDDIKSGRLRRVFVGVIDTITATGTSRAGTNILIQCRDRMRYLMDSLSTFNTGDASTLGKDLTEGGDSKYRSEVILGIARRSIGDLRGSSSIETDPRNISKCSFVNGVGIDPGLQVEFVGRTAPVTSGGRQRQPSDSAAAYVAVDGEELPITVDNLNPYAFYSTQGLDPRLKGYSLGADSDAYKQTPTRNLKFNIISGRAGYEQTDITANFQITDRVPVEYIKYMSFQEPWPTEMFSHHQTGEYWYAPRGLDTSGFKDPQRYYRTYFYRQYPKDLSFENGITVPHVCQAALSFREERSAIGWRSNIVVNNSNPNGGNTTVHVVLKPEWFKDRVTPASFYMATDPTAAGAVDLAAVGIALGRTLSKETRAGTLRVIGDPTFSPGEAIQLMGSPLNNKPNTDAQRKEDVQLVEGLKQAYTDLAVSTADQIKKETATEQNLNLPQREPKAFSSGNKVSGKNSNDVGSSLQFCPGVFQGEDSNSNVLTFASEPKSIWRVEGFTHQYYEGEEGFFTELSLLSPF